MSEKRVKQFRKVHRILGYPTGLSGRKSKESYRDYKKLNWIEKTKVGLMIKKNLE